MNLQIIIVFHIPSSSVRWVFIPIFQRTKQADLENDNLPKFTEHTCGKAGTHTDLFNSEVCFILNQVLSSFFPFLKMLTKDSLTYRNCRSIGALVCPAA